VVRQPLPELPRDRPHLPGGLSAWFLFAAWGPGFAPLHPAKGAWLRSEGAWLLSQGLGGGACHEPGGTIPNAPGLVGLSFWLQAARLDIGPIGPLALSNAVCVTITPFMPPCADPGC
jgi:hypothetical protein